MKHLLLLVFILFLGFSSHAAINQKVVAKVAESQVQSVLNAHKNMGYVPVFIDGFQHYAGNSTNRKKVTYFNIVFEKSNNVNNYEVRIANQIITYAQGQSIRFLESYINGKGQLRFALIIQKSGRHPKFVTSYGRSASFQAVFNQKKAQGYHIKTRSVVRIGGIRYTTALFERSNVGSWRSKPNLDKTQATAQMVANKNAGRTLVHMDIPTGSPTKYNLIFHQKPTNAGWYASNNLTKAQLLTAISNAKNAGYRTTIVCAYDVPGLVNGNEISRIRYAATFVKSSGVGGFVISD